MRVLQQIQARNFASFRDLTVRFSDLTVLVGPNGAGKSNLLKLFRFLGETARTDLGPAIAALGGFDQILYRGIGPGNEVSIKLSALLTRYANAQAPDEYSLSFRTSSTFGLGTRKILSRSESFLFKRTKGAGRRITLKGRDISVEREPGAMARAIKVQPTSVGLSILRKLSQDLEAPQVDELATLFETVRVFDVNVAAARQPSSVLDSLRLADDGRNLASHLAFLLREYPDLFARIEDDLRQVLPGLTRIGITRVGGAAEGDVVLLTEAGLSTPTPLALASYGTIRALALFTMLSDPDPPRLTCIEEIDHGLHPYALDRLVDRLRTAAEKTQIVVATHSPALVNRLDPSELVVFERDPATGATRSPEISRTMLAELEAESGYRLGELWFSGVLGGVPAS